MKSIAKQPETIKQFRVYFYDGISVDVTAINNIQAMALATNRRNTSLLSLWQYKVSNVKEIN